jgi:hypothetical protein
MEKLVWIIAVLAALVWSGVSWLFYLAVGVGGRFMASQADNVGSDAETVEQISNWALYGSRIGEWLVIGVWAFGAILTFALAKLAIALIRRANQPQQEDSVDAA